MSADAAGRWVEDWLSPPRFAIYLNAADHDRRTARGGYAWSTAGAAASQDDLADLEVGRRHAYDRALTAASPEGHPHWVFAPQACFPPRSQRAANEE